MELRMLGGVEIHGGDGSVAPGPAGRALLAALLASRREVVSLDHLAQVLWGDTPPVTARATLQTHISKLRQALRGVPGAALENRPPGYVLCADRSAVDADRFEDLLARARALGPVDPIGAIAALDAALACWHGDALAGYESEVWGRAEAARLEELHLVVREERVDLLLAAGRSSEVVAELKGTVRANPVRERPHTQLMLALHRTGRQAEALRVAQGLRRHLGEELGLEPSATMRGLERAIAVDDTDLRVVVEPAIRAGVAYAPTAGAHDRGPSPLPVASSTLVGRTDDLERLAPLLDRPGLVTLVGPGGVGKSTLAFELARLGAADRAAGVRVVELAAVGNPDEVVVAVAGSLGVERRPGRSLEDSVVELLAPLDLLLVIDNCEHVLAAVGRLAARVIRWCPGVRVLATSREPLAMPGETVWAVDPLPVPADTEAPPDQLAANPAVQVFLNRASHAAPGFMLDGRNATAIGDLCVALDGVPLALELAAARMGSMSPSQLRDRLQERFALLSQGPAVEPRHRTLRDLVQWSYELLSPAEQHLLDDLSVFAGGFDLDACERTSSAGALPRSRVLPLLAALVDKSLVVAEPDDGSVRYRQLETIRQFGAGRLEQRPDAVTVRAAHRITFTALSEQAEGGLDGPDEGVWSARLGREFANLRSAVRTAITDGDADNGLRMVVAAREVSFRHMHYELVRWAEELTELPAAQDHPLLPTALAVTAYGEFVRGELRRAVDWAERALGARLRLDQPADGLAERTLANALFFQGDREAAQRWMDRMIETSEHSGNDGRVAHAFYMRSVSLTSIGDLVGAERLADDSLRAAGRAGSPTAHAQATYAAGLALSARGTPAAAGEALALLDESTTVAAAAGNRWMEAFALTEAMWLRSRRGETAEALAGYRQVVETWFQSGDWANQWLSLRQLAGILASVGRDEEAALLFGAVIAAGARTALPFAPTDADELEELGRQLENRLGAEVVAAHRRRGGMMRDESVVATALAAIDDLL